MPITKVPEKADPPGSLGRVAVAAPLEILGVQVEPVDPPPRHGDSLCVGGLVLPTTFGAKRRVVGEIAVGSGRVNRNCGSVIMQQRKEGGEGKDVLIGGGEEEIRTTLRTRCGASPTQKPTDDRDRSCLSTELSSTGPLKG